MPTLSLMEEVKDKAQSLIPSPFQQAIDEVTAPTTDGLPDQRGMAYIASNVNKQLENCYEICRAIRYRLDDANPYVQLNTVLLVDYLVRNCTAEFHDELALNKALQRSLVAIAIKTPIQRGEAEVKHAALQLLLNMSYWFIGVDNDKTKMLSKLAEEVRLATGRQAFEGIECELDFQLKGKAPSQRRNVRRDRFDGTYSQSATSQRGATHNSYPGRQHVHDPPVVAPNAECIAGMLESCTVLDDLISNIVANNKNVVGDEVVQSVAVSIMRDYRRTAAFVNRGGDIENIDVLLSVCDAQTAVFQRLYELVIKEGRRLEDIDSSLRREGRYNMAFLPTTKSTTVQGASAIPQHESANAQSGQALSTTTSTSSPSAAEPSQAKRSSKNMTASIDDFFHQEAPPNASVIQQEDFDSFLDERLNQKRENR